MLTKILIDENTNQHSQCNKSSYLSQVHSGSYPQGYTLKKSLKESMCEIYTQCVFLSGMHRKGVPGT